MPLSGVNKLCAQCVHDCKQWKQVVVCCPMFASTQRRDKPEDAKQENGDTLRA